MKKQKNLKLFLNKQKISSLSNLSQQKLLGGQSYTGTSHCTCGGGGNGSEACETLAAYTCACTIPGQGIC
tara:strand:+ start:1766 stop:1975 length:210 start_codon:yes stop_codon:yes gene_type:complete